MIKSTKCDLCGNSGLHACTGAKCLNDNLPNNVFVVENSLVTDSFIDNAGKSTEKPIKFINPNDNSLYINFSQGCIFIAIICFIGFATWLSLGSPL